MRPVTAWLQSVSVRTGSRRNRAFAGEKWTDDIIAMLDESQEITASRSHFHIYLSNQGAQLAYKLDIIDHARNQAIGFFRRPKKSSSIS